MYVKWDDSNRRFQQVIHILLYAVLWKFYLSLHTNLLEPIKVLQMGIFARSQEEQSEFNCTAFWGIPDSIKNLLLFLTLHFFFFYVSDILCPKGTIPSFRPGFKIFLLTQIFPMHTFPYCRTGPVVPVCMDRRNGT